MEREQAQGPSDRPARDDLSDDFRELFLRVCPGGDSSAENRLAAWRAIVAHPWYQAQLSASAGAVSRDPTCPRVGLDDVRDEAMLVLAQELARTGDLCVDRSQVGQTFSHWFASIIRRDCRQAVRRLKHALGLGQLIEMDDFPSRAIGETDALIDVKMCAKRLREPEKTLVLLHVLELYSSAEIARKFGLDYDKVRRALRRGSRHLNAEMKSNGY